MHRFIVNSQNIYGQTLEIKGEEARHITKVLRKKIGDQIAVFDGSGKEYLVEIKQMLNGSVIGAILQETEADTEPEIEVCLAQCLTKGTKMDFIVQKCTEIGVTEIMPVESMRTIVHWNSQKAQEKQERWQRIAQEAAKQSKRVKVPRVAPVLPLTEILKLGKGYDLSFMLWEGERDSCFKELIQQNRQAKRIFVLIGPEGGFSAEEVDLARRAGIKPVSIGPRILRTETAGMVTLAMLLYALDSLGGKS